MTFIEKASSFDGSSKVRTWLFGILYRKIMEARRQIQKDGRHEDIDEVIEERFNSNGSWRRPPEPIDEMDMQYHIGDCLETVPLRQQLAFVLREVEGFSMGEICGIMQMSRSNLGVSLHRGRNQLRDCLEQKGISNA